MRYPLSLLLLSGSLTLAAQDPTKQIAFEGYLFGADSIPAIDAHLISYQTMKIVTTDENGRFVIYAEPGDSLMINHINLQPTVIHVSSNRETNHYFIPYRRNMIGTVFTNPEEDLRMKYFEDNKKAIGFSIQELDLTPNMSETLRMSPYNPDEANPGLNIPLFYYLRKLLRKKKDR